jgi:hypothetical protein
MKNRHASIGLLLAFVPVGLAHAAQAALKIPPAITTFCATPPNSALVCKDLQEFLDAFNAETRADAWAKDMEARIRKATLAGGKTLREIRTLQCRRGRSASTRRIRRGRGRERTTEPKRRLRLTATRSRVIPDAPESSVEIRSPISSTTCHPSLGHPSLGHPSLDRAVVASLTLGT